MSAVCAAIRTSGTLLHLKIGCQPDQVYMGERELGLLLYDAR